MTVDEMSELFEKHNDEFLKFEEVKNKLHRRRDIHAFILLDKLCPSTGDIVAVAEHDIIYLEPDGDKVAEVITEEQVIELVRCGVMFESGNESFSMFA